MRTSVLRIIRQYIDIITYFKVKRQMYFMLLSIYTTIFGEFNNADNKKAAPELHDVVRELLYSGYYSDKLDNSHFSCISASRTNLYDPCVTAVSLVVLGSYFIEQLLGNGFLGNVCKNLTLRVKIALLTESDHLLCFTFYFLSSRNGSLYLAVFE